MAIGKPDQASVEAGAEEIYKILNPDPVEEQANQGTESEQGLNPATEPAPVEAEPTEQAQEPETLAEASEPEAPTLYDVMHGDKVVQRTLDELKAGDMMQADYTRKTMEISDQKRAYEAKTAQVDQALIKLNDSVRSDAEHLASVEMQQLRVDDPGEYLNQLEKVRAKNDTLVRMQEDKAARDAEAFQARITDEAAKMIQSIPTWLDQKVKAKEWQELGIYLGAKGTDISKIMDHKDIVYARNSMLYERGQSNTTLDQQKVRTPPKSTTPSGANAEVPDAVKSRRETLAKSGKASDAAAVIQDIVNRGGLSGW